MNLSRLLQESPKELPILQGTFGLERESLRINSQNQVAQTPHPVVLGSRSFHPYIQTDYSEAQLELITPVCHSTKEARRWLKAIGDVAHRSMEPTEYLWPFSMPPRIREDEIQIAQLEDLMEYRYREGLAERYGKKLQSMSGIHYNFQLGTELTKALFAASGYKDLVAFQNDLYLKIAQNFLIHRWLLTYLYGASSLAEADFLSDNPGFVRSIRNSNYGYVNKEDVKISFASLEQYVTDIEAAVASGHLSAEKEFYAAVRLRGAKASRDYLQKGITYLEFRNFDLNPFDHLAISQKTLDTTHLFILAMLWIESVPDVDVAIAKAQELNNHIALSHPLTPLPDAANHQVIITALREVCQHFQLDSYYQELVTEIETAINQPEQTLAAKLYQQLDQHSLEGFGQVQGRKIQELACTAPYALKGFEKMELSTQMILFDAIQMGLAVDILDEEDQFLKLSHGDHIEYIKNGNMTAKDNYVVPLAMANKVVTKKILAAAGFPVPHGQEFSDRKSALNYYHSIQNSAIVIKPKSTNFGLGISIFQEPANLKDYEKAVDIAFSEDSHILVEEFVEGTEYRFFILDDRCEAVLLRVAANVIGDGQHTIRELVDLKNQDPLRGYDHRSPLEIIQLNAIELLMLEQQGFTPDTILKDGEQAFLRRNSNISTGGDSIDMTEQMDESYKRLAEEMATTMGAWTCGVDLIIPDIQQVASKAKPYSTCIELNFNPAMYLHTYCYEGPGQVLTKKILKKLFPEWQPVKKS